MGLNPRFGAFSHMATFEICKDWAIDLWAVSDEGNGILNSGGEMGLSTKGIWQERAMYQ